MESPSVLRRVQRFAHSDLPLRCALFFVLVATMAATRADPDLWGHLRFGMDILRDGVINQTDVYSFSADRVWVNHEWAAEVVTAIAFTVGGAPGLIVLKIFIVFGTLLLLRDALVQQQVGARGRDVLLALAVLVTIQQAHHVRPQLFSLLFFAMLLNVLLRAQSNARWLFTVPIIFGLWANLHGGWIVGGAVLVAWTAGLAARGSWLAAARHVATGTAALLATLANPRGFGLLQFLYETVGLGRADIVDWQPVYVLGPAIWIPWLVTFVLSLVALRSIASRRPIEWERLLPIAVLAIGALQVNRLTAFFGLVTLFAAGHHLSSPRAARPRSSAANHSAAFVGAAVAAVVVAFSVRATASHMGCVRVDRSWTPQRGAIEYFQRQHLKGRLLVWFGWGQYALWHLTPDILVSIDGRRETAYSAALQRKHLNFYFDVAGSHTLPDELGADYIWIPRGLVVIHRLSSTGWHIAYEDTDSVVLSRYPVQTRVTAGTVPQANSCFPEP
jgi:hypothetical protein